MKSRMKRVAAVLLGISMLVITVGCGKSDEEYKGKLIKVSITVSSQTPVTKAMNEVFKPELEKRLNGKYDIQLYDSGILGAEKVTYDYTKSGIIEMSVVGTSMWSETPKMTIPDFPFIFKDVEHAKACYQGALGEYIQKDIEATQPVKLLSWMPNGARAFSSNRKLERVEDFKGQKMRMPNNPIHVKLAESLGASVVIMDMGEVFTSLEQGVVDGQDNPIATLKSAGWYEVQNYVYNTNHIISSLELFAGEAFWNQLTAEEQQIFQEVADETAEYAWNLYIEELEADKQFIKDQGIQVTELTEADREVLKNKVQPVYDYLNKQYDWVDEAKSIIEGIK